MSVHTQLLEVLVCPACKGALEQVREEAATLSALDCPKCRLRFPVRDDIPVMLLDQATRIPA